MCIEHTQGFAGKQRHCEFKRRSYIQNINIWHAGLSVASYKELWL